MNGASLIDHVDRLMRRLDAEMHRRAPEADADRVGPLASILLARLDRIAPAQMQEQMTRAVRSLEAKGLILRSESEEDRRVAVLALTSKGRQYVQCLNKVMDEIVGDLLSPLSPADRQAFAAILERL